MWGANWKKYSSTNQHLKLICGFYPREIKLCLIKDKKKFDRVVKLFHESQTLQLSREKLVTNLKKLSKRFHLIFTNCMATFCTAQKRSLLFKSKQLVCIRNKYKYYFVFQFSKIGKVKYHLKVNKLIKYMIFHILTLKKLLCFKRIKSNWDINVDTESENVRQLIQ
jgi:hypothetical protein